MVLGRRRSRVRAAFSALGIALGVALGYGVHLVNGAAVEDLAASVRALAGEADLQVRGGRSGFPERLFPQVARVPGVSWVNPVLELDAGIAGTERTLRVIGVDALRVGRPELLAPDKVLLSPMAAAELGEGRLPLVVGERVVELEIGPPVCVRHRAIELALQETQLLNPFRAVSRLLVDSIVDSRQAVTFLTKRLRSVVEELFSYVIERREACR